MEKRKIHQRLIHLFPLKNWFEISDEHARDRDYIYSYSAARQHAVTNFLGGMEYIFKSSIIWWSRVLEHLFLFFPKISISFPQLQYIQLGILVVDNGYSQLPGYIARKSGLDVFKLHMPLTFYRNTSLDRLITNYQSCYYNSGVFIQTWNEVPSPPPCLPSLLGETAKTHIWFLCQQLPNLIFV